MTISFIGHALVPQKDKVGEQVKKQIRNSIGEDRRVVCYLGGYGDFDEICACSCRELKREFEKPERIYVTPYMTSAEQRRIKEMQDRGLCDGSLYPPLENTPPRFAISKRNEWMIDQADLIIAYVNRSYGGAYQSLQMAKRRGKKIVNICDFLDPLASR